MRLGGCEVERLQIKLAPELAGVNMAKQLCRDVRSKLRVLHHFEVRRCVVAFPEFAVAVRLNTRWDVPDDPCRLAPRLGGPQLPPKPMWSVCRRAGGRRDGLGWLRNGILGLHRHGLPCKLSERIGSHIPVRGFMANRVYDGVDGDDLQPGLHRRERAAVPAIGGGCNLQNVTKSWS